MRVKWVISIFLLVPLIFSACDLIPGESSSDTADESDAATVTPAATVEVDQAPPVFEVPATATPAAVDLKVWIPPQLAVLTEAGTQTMADQFTDYNARNPEIAVRVEQKRVLGDTS